MARISPCTSAMFFSTFLAVFLLVISTSATKVTDEIVEDQEAVESKRSTHSQKLEQGRTRGEYRIFLPDNRWQIVSYVADDDGYRATVRYENGPHDIPRSEQSHWGFSTGGLNSPVSSEPGRSDPPTYPPRITFPPQNSGQPPFSKQPFPPQFQPYQGVVTSQVNTFVVHPTPTDRGRELEDNRKRVEQHRPPPNVPGGLEPKSFHHNSPKDAASAPSSSPPPVYIPQPNPYAAQQPPRPTTPAPIYTAPRPEKYPDPPVYIPKEKSPKVEEQDISIIYDPKVYHPFYQPTEKPRILAAQPIRPFHLPDQFYENRPYQQQQQPVISNLERPVRPNPIPQQQNEPRPQLNQQEPPPQRYPPTAPPPKVENRPPQQQNPRPYLDKPSSNQWTPLYQPAPTRPTYPPKPYEPQPYPSTPSYPNKPTEPPQRPFKASPPFNPVDQYVVQQRPQYQPAQPYEPRPRPPYPSPPFYPERPIQPYEPQQKPTYPDKPAEVYIPQQRPLPPTYPDKPVESYEPQQRPDYKPVQPYETEAPKYETTPSYPEKPIEPNEADQKPITFFSNNPPELYEPQQQKPSYKPIPSYPDKPTRPYEPEQKPEYEATPPEKPVEPRKPVTFFSNEPEESYEPEQKPEEPIQREEKPVYDPVYSDKPAVAYEPEEKPEPATSYPTRRPQYNEEYRPQYQPRPFVNQQPNDFRPLYPLYPPRPGQPIRPLLKPGYVVPESNYRPEKRPYGVPHAGYSPGTPLSGIAITSIRPILNPINQSLVTITLDESLEGEAPTEPPEFEEQEEVTSTTKKPEPLRKFKVNQPIFRKPTYQNSPPRSKIVRPSNNRVPASSVPIEPVTEKSIDQEDSPLLAKFKFKGSTTSNNDGYGQRTQPRRKQPSQKQTINDFTVTSLLEEDGPSESIRGYSRLRDENDESYSVTVIPDEDQISDLESFLPVEEEFYSNKNSDSDVIFFDDGIIPPLLLRVRDKISPPKIEEVTVPYVTTDYYQTEIPTTTMTPTEFPSITAPPTEIPSTTIRPTTAITTTTAATTTTTSQTTSTKAGTRKKKKRVRVKSLKRGNGTGTIMPASKKVQSVSVIVKEEEKAPVIKVASTNSTVTAPRTHSPRIRFPPKVRFVQKTAERVTRQNDKDARDEDLIASDSVNLAVTSLRENDKIGDHAATIEDMMEWSLNSIPIDRLDLVYDSAELEEKPVE